MRINANKRMQMLPPIAINLIGWLMLLLLLMRLEKCVENPDLVLGSTTEVKQRNDNF